jgi:hypothetical protein
MTGALLVEAREHLQAVRPWASTTMFQTFPEARGSRGRAQVFAGPHDRVGAPLDRLNERGHGIYYAPSDFRAGRRRKEDVTRLRHVWVDHDAAPLPSSWPLEPHAITVTSEGKHHVVWIVDGLPLDFELHNRVLSALAREYGGDEGARGANRVLRLAGYQHLKRDPFLVRLLSVGDHRAWTFLEVKSAWPRVAIAAAPPPPPKPVDAGTLTDRYVRAALEGEATIVATAPEKRRNTTLARAAFKIGTLAGAGALDPEAAIETMIAAAMQAGLPEREARSTTERQVKAGMKHPRTAREAA